MSGPGKLVAFMPDVLATPQLEIQLEHIQKHLDRGGTAVVLRCDGELQTCEANNGHDRHLCSRCQKRFANGMRWLRGSVVEHPFHTLTRAQEATIQALSARQWWTAEELCALQVEGADIGMAAFSTVVAMTRDAAPDFTLHQEFVRRSVVTAALVYFSLKTQLGRHRADVFAVFNARLSSTRPGLRAAQMLDVDCDVLEVAGVADRYSISRNTLPHDLDRIKQTIEETFSGARLTEQECEEVLGWYEERRRGVTRDCPSYTSDQSQGLLPPELQPDKVNLVVFRSSEYEFAGVDDWHNPFYATQNEGIRRLLADLRPDRVRVFVRIHPNQRGVNNPEMRELDDLACEHDNLVVIHAGSLVSTYALMDAADVVLTFGSTTGIESAFAGKPSILMGRAEYEDLNVCHRPRSHADLTALVRQIAEGHPPSVPKDLRVGLLKYAYFQQCAGELHQYVERTGFFTASMRRGQVLEEIAGSTSVAMNALTD
jgi:hypothetical protein